MYRQAYREALLIICSAVILGFSYTYLTEKGLWGTAKASDLNKAGAVGPPPSSINYAEAKLLYDKGSALFIDARHFFDFRRSHIKSAVNIPLAEFETKQKTIEALPKDKVIIVYCDASECNSSIELAAKLYERGFGGVRIFFGGWQDWNSNKSPLESSQ